MQKNKKFYIEFLKLSNLSLQHTNQQKNLQTEKNNSVIFDNNGAGFDVNSGVTYIEVGDIPFTIRYADYNQMFKGAITVIIQYTEEPAKITVATLDNKLSRSLILGGTPDCNDVGVFKLFIK